MAGKKETLEQWWRRHNRHREEENRRPRPYVLGQANCCITPRIPEPNLELIERQRLQTSILEGMRQTDSSLPDYLRDCDGPTDDHCEEETWPPYPYVLEQSTCSITPSSPEPNPSPELNGGRSLQTDILESMREMSSLPDFWRDCGGDIDEYTSRMPLEFQDPFTFYENVARIRGEPLPVRSAPFVPRQRPASQSAASQRTSAPSLQRQNPGQSAKPRGRPPISKSNAVPLYKQVLHQSLSQQSPKPQQAPISQPGAMGPPKRPIVRLSVKRGPIEGEEEQGMAKKQRL